MRVADLVDLAKRTLVLAIVKLGHNVIPGPHQRLVIFGAKDKNSAPLATYVVL